MWGVPAQQFGQELLDGAIDDPEELRSNLRDMALANRLLLSNRAVLRRIADWLRELPPEHTATILDVATGAGGLPRAIGRWARRRGRQVRLLASDMDAMVVDVARQALRGSNVALLRHNAWQMPFGDRSIDIVTCAFSLHHFAAMEAVALLREMARVARRGVIVSDLRRSYGGYWGARLLALGMGNRLSRHDGPLSVLRAYTPAEAQALVDVAGIDGRARSEPAFRLVVTFDQVDPAMYPSTLPAPALKSKSRSGGHYIK